MATKNGPLDARKLQGFKYFELIDGLLERLRPVGTQRDRAGNRDLYFDHYATLMILDYFNPTVTTLRGLQQFTTLEKVQRLCGVQPTSLGALSEAARVFDPAALEPIITELAAQAGRNPLAMPSAKEAALAGLIAVDGSLLPALPRMAWALWQDATHRAAKMHVAFAVFPGTPVGATVTAGHDSEREELKKLVQPGGFYVADRGDTDDAMFREFDGQGVRFLIRLQEKAVFDVWEERPLSADDLAAGVIRDVTIKRLGTKKHNRLLEQPLRIVTVRGAKPGQVWVLATNALDLPAELIAIAYRYRWQIELFFRWLKCVLGCKHLLSESQSGVTLQVYCGIIAALLIGLWVGVKPNKRTYKNAVPLPERLGHSGRSGTSSRQTPSQIDRTTKLNSCRTELGCLRTAWPNYVRARFPHSHPAFHAGSTSCCLCRKSCGGVACDLSDCAGCRIVSQYYFGQHWRPNEYRESWHHRAARPGHCCVPE